MANKTIRALREIPIEVSRILNGRYPSFVTSHRNTPLGQQVPVFMFHSVERSLFETQLAYLQKNQYQTLTISTFMAFLRGERSLDGPSVLLTFDDGHKSWYEVAYPLLKQYGFHAVGFLVPTFIQEQPAPGAWLSWPEIEEMEQSGVMSFESHTAHHDQIFVGPKLIDFYHPTYDYNPLELDTPWIYEGEHYTNRLRWGTPLYTHASRFAGLPRFLDEPAIRQACIELVEQRGKDTFFAQSNWRQILTKRYQTIARYQTAPRYESRQTQRSSILADLLRAQQMMETKLDRSPQHLCYPWGIGSELAVTLSQEAGYISNFWVANKQRNSNRPGDCLFYIPRLKDDYLMRLPGLRRQSLASIFIMKMHRRYHRNNIY